MNGDITGKQQEISENQAHEVRAGSSDSPQGWEALPDLALGFQRSQPDPITEAWDRLPWQAGLGL